MSHQPPPTRKYSPLDQLLMKADALLEDLAGSGGAREERAYPAAGHEPAELDEAERRHIAGLMRVNHAGEIAAQALYKAQALTAREATLKQAMRESADEEIDHLNWCEQRLRELDDHTTYLAPFWYAGSFAIGFVAGVFGDKWNLGFLAETEYQVVRHLDSHLAQIPERDRRSRAILEQMRADELHHADKAETAGAETLPKSIKHLMNLSSKVLTKTAYRL